MIRRAFNARFLGFLLTQTAKSLPLFTLSSITKRTKHIFAFPTFAFATSILFAAQLKKDMAEIEKADEIYNQNKFQELYEYLLQFKESDNPELLWRLVRATRDRATMAEVSKEDKKKMIFEAFEVSKRGLELGEDIGACHKWYGIMLSQTGDYLGTKAKIESSPAMKKHFEKAAELDPEDATARHLIGMWCFSFADLAWYERKIAAVVFGSPPESTYQEALEHFQKAEELSPSFYSKNQLMLGTVNLRLNNKEEAKKWFNLLLKFEVIKEDDKQHVTEAEAHLKSL